MDCTQLQKVTVPAVELAARLERLRERLGVAAPGWQAVAIMGRVNLYYLTGTMQNGLLLIPRDGPAVYYVRKSIARALDESPFPCIRPIRSFRDVQADLPAGLECIHLEKQALSLAHFELFNRYFDIRRIEDLDPHIRRVRAVKSPYEIERLRQAGHIQRTVLEECLPAMLREGMSETELAAELMREMILRGHEGLSRVASFNAELFLGHVCFGENAIYGAAFAGPGGVHGLGPAAPFFGNRHRRLKKGDLVSIDVGCCVEGYNTDKTITFCYRHAWSEPVAEKQACCCRIEQIVAEHLRPHTRASDLYALALREMPAEYRGDFMGSGADQVRFVGHGVGLEIDETPVLAKGFDDPLEENMTLAIEPKIWIEHVGMVGRENTYLVTPTGGQCLTAEPGQLRQTTLSWPASP